MKAPKMIPVATWAAARYDPPPSDWILRRWCRDGEIYPPPEKAGKDWRASSSLAAGTNAIHDSAR